MTDPLGLIGNTNPIHPRPGPAAPAGGTPLKPAEGPGFRELLEQQIAQVNELQQDAKEAVEDFAAGRRDDIETVIIATDKADTAFRMLLQVRNKMLEAYEEVKQVRV
jgi:flagellar hook-basal body complex protein FliE